MALAVLAATQAELRGLSRAPDGEAQEGLRLRAAHALDTARAEAQGVRAADVDALLLKPPWRSARIAAAAARAGASCSATCAGELSDETSAFDVAECRRHLCAARPHVSGLLAWLDERASATEPYRRLPEVRHAPWANASVDATLAAVRAARARLGRAPTVLVADGSLGVEAASAAAAGASVCVCEPNRFAARAIAEVAAAHGVGHAVRVVPISLEELCGGSSARGVEADVVVLSPLIDPSGCDRRIVPAARAVARWAAAAPAGSQPPRLVPERLLVRGAAACLSAGRVCGVDLRPLDAARWAGPALAISAELEEGGRLLSRFEPLVELDLRGGGLTRLAHGGAVRFSYLGSDGDAVDSVEKESVFNAVVLDVRVDWEASRAGCAVPTPHKRAVQYIEPVAPSAWMRVCVRCNGLRIWVEHAEAVAPLGAWGRVLIQPWHFAMLRDEPRNRAYAAALRRAAAELQRAATAGASPLALDVGCGSGLLSLLLARAGAPQVVGVEVLSGLADLGRSCVEANGAQDRVQIVRSEAAALCSQPPPGAPRASLFLAELMDGGGLGESLLGLAAAATRGGMLVPGARMLPRRLRVWATLVCLHTCGTPLDSAELLPSSCRNVSLHPWLRMRAQRSYSAIDLHAAQYAPLSAEALVYEATVGEEPPADAQLALTPIATGEANAVVWVWEAQLDDADEPPLTNAPWAERTHWRQAVRLLPERREVREGEAVRLGVATGGGRELAFRLSAHGANGAPPPAAVRPHVRRSTRGLSQETPAEAFSSAAASAAAAGQAVACGGTHPSAGPACLGSRWLSRSAFRSRRSPTVRSSLAPPTPDDEWLRALHGSEFTADRFRLRPNGCAHSVLLCEAALDIAAQPAMLGVSAADAQQAVRVLYAS